MNLEEKRRMEKNWRGRRFIVCRAIADIKDVIEHLGVEENSDPLPEGFVSTITPQMKQELQNQAANLLRTIILHNDGNISNQKLNFF